MMIDTDPTLIDVNIHPTKQDIKFSKIEGLKTLITETVNSTLKKALLIPKIDTYEYQEINEYPTISDVENRRDSI